VLDEVVRLISDWLHRRLTQERITLDLRLNAPSAFPFPSGEMEHILMNLLDNALHAVCQSDVGGRRITVKTWCEPGWVCLSVADNGPGVPEHLQDKIFDLSQSSKPEGMGLGLWLARYLVERHGGQLGLTPASTTGACFNIKLPLQ
jgi:signal transduction histidine kinase